MNKTGKAYGFFDCKASKKEIETELSTIRRLAKIPSELELSLTELADVSVFSLHGNPQLYSIVKDAKEAKMGYYMEALYPNTTNKAAADEIATILNQTYQSPLYKKGEPFKGEIVYEENGEYIFRE